jgi:hypothetical protein
LIISERFKSGAGSSLSLYGFKSNLLISEPSHHVSKEDFDVSVETAKKIGFQVKEYLKIRSSFSVMLKT